MASYLKCVYTGIARTMGLNSLKPAVFQVRPSYATGGDATCYVAYPSRSRVFGKLRESKSGKKSNLTYLSVY